VTLAPQEKSEVDWNPSMEYFRREETSGFFGFED